MTWYIASDERRKVRQVVIELPAGGARDSKFGSLGLAAKYENLLSQTWCAGYFRTDAEKGPFLLVRADGHVAKLKESPLRVAFSCYREPSGGVLGVFVAAENPELRKASQTGHAVFECVYGLDFQDTVERIRDGLSRDVIHLCFADAATNMRMSMIDASGQSREMTAPACRFDRVFPVPDDCRRALVEEFRELMAYHRSLAPSRRDYTRSMQQLSADFPASEHPILNRTQQNAPALPSAKARQSFWKRLFGTASQSAPPGRPAFEVLPFEKLEHVVLFTKAHIESFSPSDEMQLVFEELTGRSIQEISQKAGFQLFRNSGNTLDLAKKGSVAIIAASELGLKLGSKELPDRLIAGALKSTERYFRDSKTGHEFVIVLLYGA